LLLLSDWFRLIMEGTQQVYSPLTGADVCKRTRGGKDSFRYTEM
jgi:hypothetical protein